ncbi:hypothetical protein [Promicromonospora sp. NFX87]|uniref:hypothetical protein n=1 Tax=Promicromonospora sp. NFX87 TaxID=3402691 RepID=UPI003AFB49AB
MDIETLAVNKISDMVAYCPRLRPFIDKNDKTPLTDGHIAAYSSPGGKNQDWLGRASVQVKGRTAPQNQRRPKATYRIDRTDLISYQRDGGVIYFVVSIDAKTGKRTPQYALLSPFKIAHLIKQAPEKQASISVPLKRFPDTPEDIEEIVILAIKAKNQLTSLVFDPVLFKDVQSIKVYTTAKLDLSTPLTLTLDETDFALEVTTSQGSSFQLSGEFEIIPSDYIANEVDATVRAGESTYDRVTTRRIDANTVEATLAGGLTLLFNRTQERQKFNVNMTPQGNYAERVKALEFFIGIADRGELEVNGRAIPLGDMADAEQSGQPVDEIREHLETLRKLGELFAHLDVEGALVDLDELDDEQTRTLLTVHRALVQGEELYNANGETGRSTVPLGSWALMLLVLPGSAPDHWRFVDPFNPETSRAFRIRAESDAQDPTVATAYDIIGKERLPKILNLRLGNVDRAYNEIAESDRTTGRANQFVLDLILAADSCTSRKDEFLQGARTLNEWIIRNEGEQEIHLINRWQIEWRERDLTPSELASIRELRRTVIKAQPERADEFELACVLLLKDKDEAEHLIGQMPEDKLRAMKEWPIWRLHGGNP